MKDAALCRSKIELPDLNKPNIEVIMSRNSIVILNRLKNNDFYLKHLIINDPLYSDHDLRELLHASKHNIYLVQLSVINSNISDRGVKLLLKNTFLCDCQVSSRHISKKAIAELQRHLAKNRRAQRLLYVEQAIVFTQIIPQNALPLARFSRDILIIILVHLAKVTGLSTQNIHPLLNLIFTNLSHSENKLRQWHIEGNYQGLHMRIFKPWKSQIEYIEHTIRYTQGFTEALAIIPELKEMITTPFMLKVLKTAWPKIQEQFSPRRLTLFQRKEFSKKLLYDIFINEHFLEQEKWLKQNNLVGAHENIYSALWQYAQSLAQAMHQANLQTVIYEESEQQTLTSTPSSHNPWHAFFNRSNPRLALLRTACCVVEIKPNQYAFLDYSLLEYFVNCHVVERLTQKVSSINNSI
jgi:hypothetical protein